MIVVDANVISYLLLPGPFTGLARIAVRKEEWCAPVLWRSEFRNVLALYLRRNSMALEDAQQQMQAAERLLGGREFTVRSTAVLQCVQRSQRSVQRGHRRCG